MDDLTNGLGEYLRARRDLTAPDAAGFPSSATRRVAGLRRDEVALLAGISTDYYLRLEQGRERHPSAQVLRQLARVFELDAAATAYLFGLAVEQPRSRRRVAHREAVPDSIRNLLSVLALPAFLEDRYFDILASNSAAVALSPQLTVGENRLKSLFLNAGERDLYHDWEATTAVMVAGFRASVGTDADDPRFIELVGELSLNSARFRALWARHDIKLPHTQRITLEHPVVGRITLTREKLILNGPTAPYVLAVYHPEAGSPSAEKLGILTSYAAEARDAPNAPDQAGTMTDRAPR